MFSETSSHSCATSGPLGFRRDESGNIAIVVALCLTALIGIGGLAIDYSTWVNKKVHLQAIADGAVLAGAQAIAAGTPDQVLDTTNKYLASQNLDGVTPQVSTDLAARRVRVSLSGFGKALLSSVLGQGDKIISVTAESEASESASHGLCVLALDQDANPGILIGGSGTLNAPNCIIWSNSKANQSIQVQGNVSVQAAALCGVGGVSNKSNGPVSPYPIGGCAPQVDPYAAFSLPIPSGCDFTNFSANAASVTINPGTYCGGISITGDTIVANPGIYYIKDGLVRINGNSDVTMSGATIYLSGMNSGITVAGNALLDISAPVTGPSANFAIAMDPNAQPAGWSNFTGSTEITIVGVIHLPQQKIWMTGNSSGAADLSDAVMVGKEVEFFGSATWSWIADNTVEQVKAPQPPHLVK